MISSVIIKICFMYLYIFLGGMLKKFLHIPSKAIIKILFFILIPIIVFKSVLLSNLEVFLGLIGLSFLTSLTLSLASLVFWGRFKKLGLSKGLYQCCYGYLNIGWFGIPIVYSIWGEKQVITITAIYVGGMLFGHTIGYYLINKESTKKSLYNFLVLFKNPSFYAIIFGFLLSYDYSNTLSTNPIVILIFRTATQLTSFLGMFLVGMSIYGINVKRILWKEILLFLLSRLVLSLAVVGIFITILLQFQLFSESQLYVYSLVGVLPIAANIIVFTHHKKSKEKILEAILLGSTILSCIVICVLILLNAISEHSV